MSKQEEWNLAHPSRKRRNFYQTQGLSSPDDIPVHGRGRSSRGRANRPEVLLIPNNLSNLLTRLPNNLVDPHKTHIILDANIPIAAFGVPHINAALSTIEIITSDPTLQPCISTSMLDEWYDIMKLREPCTTTKFSKCQFTPESKSKTLALVSQAGAITKYVSGNDIPNIDADPADNRLFVALFAIARMGPAFIVSFDRHVLSQDTDEALSPQNFLDRFKK